MEFTISSTVWIVGFLFLKKERKEEGKTSIEIHKITFRKTRDSPQARRKDIKKRKEEKKKKKKKKKNLDILSSATPSASTPLLINNTTNNLTFLLLIPPFVFSINSKTSASFTFQFGLGVSAQEITNATTLGWTEVWFFIQLD